MNASSASATTGIFGPEFDSEQRPSGDGECRLHHLAVDVEFLSVAPAVQHAVGLLSHDVGIRGDAGAMKRGLAQPALAQPELALAG